MREANLARLLARRPDGIFLSDFEQGEIGPDMFVAARLSEFFVKHIQKSRINTSLRKKAACNTNIPHFLRCPSRSGHWCA